jgi:hypothetical protein
VPCCLRNNVLKGPSLSQDTWSCALAVSLADPATSGERGAHKVEPSARPVAGVGEAVKRPPRRCLGPPRSGRGSGRGLARSSLSCHSRRERRGWAACFEESFPIIDNPRSDRRQMLAGGPIPARPAHPAQGPTARLDHLVAGPKALALGAAVRRVPHQAEALVRRSSPHSPLFKPFLTHERSPPPPPTAGSSASISSLRHRSSLSGGLP